MKKTSSIKKLSILLLLVFLTGCSSDKEALQGLGLWANIATMPIPEGAMGDILGAMSAISLVFVGGYYFFSDRENKAGKTFVLIAVAGMILSLTVFLSNLGRHIWPPGYTFTYIFMSLGLPFDGPMSMWAIAWTIIAAVIHLGIQLLILIWVGLALVAAAAHFDTDRLLGPLGLIIGWLTFPWVHFLIVKTLASIGPSLFGKLGAIANWVIPTAGLYLFLTIVAQFFCYIWLPRELARKAHKLELIKRWERNAGNFVPPPNNGARGHTPNSNGSGPSPVPVILALPDGSTITGVHNSNTSNTKSAVSNIHGEVPGANNSKGPQNGRKPANQTPPAALPSGQVAGKNGDTVIYGQAPGAGKNPSGRTAASHRSNYASNTVSNITSNGSRVTVETTNPDVKQTDLPPGQIGTTVQGGAEGVSDSQNHQINSPTFKTVETTNPDVKQTDLPPGQIGTTVQGGAEGVNDLQSHQINPPTFIVTADGVEFVTPERHVPEVVDDLEQPTNHKNPDRDSKPIPGNTGSYVIGATKRSSKRGYGPRTSSDADPSRNLPVINDGEEGRSYDV